MADKPIVLSKHAQDMIDERKIPFEWVEHVLRHPIFEEPDRQNAGAVRAYAPVPSTATACSGWFIMKVVSKFG